jgi:hypothetical protein
LKRLAPYLGGDRVVKNSKPLDISKRLVANGKN